MLRPDDARRGRSTVHATRAMVATSQPLATVRALEVLKEGGSAVDAAICANAVLGVVEPTGCGIGGDLMALVHEPTGKAPVGYNGSGRSPRGLEREHFVDRGLAAIPARGGLSVSVPGCVDGWFALHERFGELPFRRLLEPAIEAARDGFALSPIIAAEWERGLAALSEYRAFVDQFTLGGDAPRAGEVMRRTGLADVLERIADEGRAAFYGEIDAPSDLATRIERAVAAEGGVLSAQDLARHAGEWVEPLAVRYRDAEVFELPGNTQGPAAALMLAICERFDVGSMPRGGVDRTHLFVEAKKRAFAARARMIGDPTHHTSKGLDGSAMLDPAFVDEQVAAIDLARAGTELAAGGPRVARGDTVTLSVADERGQLVSLIQSNFRGFGSGVAPSGLGFVLQNRGELFDLSDDAGANGYAPGKRPFHTIIPGLARRDERPWLAFGVMGGDTQPQGHLQVLSNLLDGSAEQVLDLQDAGDAPRVVHDGAVHPTGAAVAGADGLGEVLLEEGFAEEVATALEARGHRVRVGVPSLSGWFGGYQAVARRSARDSAIAVYSGGSDGRKDGCAAGS